MTLYEIIQEVLDKHADEADPATLAWEVLDAIPKRQLPNILHPAVTSAVRQRMSDYRRHNPLPIAQSSRSRKWEIATEQYNALLRRRESVAGEWKFLSDCTVADLLLIAQERRDKAAELEVVAEGYQNLATVMERQKVARVADLKPSDVKDALAAAA